MKACLTLTSPKCAVAGDPGGTFTDGQALDVLESEVSTAEDTALDDDQKPGFRVVMNAPYLFGPGRVAMPDLVARITVLNP